MEQAVVFPKFRWLVGLAAAFAQFTFGALVVSFAPLLPVIGREFGRPVGSLLIAFFSYNSIAIGLAVLASGPAVDKFGPRKVMLGSAILVLIYCLLLPIATHSIFQITVLRLFLGIGLGPAVASLAALMQRWFPRNEQGTVLGITKGCLAIGTAFVFLVMPKVMAAVHGDWRKALATGAFLMAAQTIILIISLFGTEPPIQFRAAKGVAPEFKLSLTLSAFWGGALLLALSQGIMQCINGLTASYMVTPAPVGLGWKPWVAGPNISLIQFGMIISGLLMGILLKFIFQGSAKWLAATSYLLAGAAAFSVVQSFAHGQMSIKIVFFALGFLMNIGYPAVSTYITANYPPHILGKVFGTSASIAVFGGAVASGIAGIILDKTHSFYVVYGFVGILGILGLLIAAGLLNPIKAFKKESQPAAVTPTAVAAK